MKKSAAVTLTELLVAIAIFSIVSGVLVLIFVSGWRVYYRETATLDTQGQAKLITSIITQEIQQASAVIVSRDFGGTPYTSSSNTVVLKLPAIDSKRDVIEGSFDYQVFYLDTNRLKSIIEATPASTRRSETKTISSMVSSLAFVYKMANGTGATSPAEAEIIKIKVTTSRTSFGKIKKTSLVGQAKLRNK